eukprot:6192401-Pleurochrysis_carterae.AAC.1
MLDAGAAMRSSLLLAQFTLVLTPSGLPTPDWRAVTANLAAKQYSTPRTDVPPRVVRAATAFAAAAATAAATVARASAYAPKRGDANVKRKRRPPA